MSGSTYVVFDGDNDHWAYGYMKGWKVNDRVEFDFRDAHDIGSMTGRAQDENYVKSELRKRMKASTQVLVLVGESTKNLRKYVGWEIDLAPGAPAGAEVGRLDFAGAPCSVRERGDFR